MIMEPSSDEVGLTAKLSSLTRAQKAALTAGADRWRSTSVPEAGIGWLKFTDGPAGARGAFDSGTSSMSFPCGSAVGATWDVELAEEFGRALAGEALSKGAHVLLGPTVNLHRHPLAGRNFECLSEDPELTARLASAIVRGLQSRGVGACVKHFVANDQETGRMSISAEVDERTLREVYLRPFESAVASADPWTIMAAYNKINGEYATENTRLLTDILKKEWGWQGVVISDWWATHDSVRPARAGLDLEMPGPPRWLGPALEAVVEGGEVSEEVLDEMAERMMRLLARAGRLDSMTEEPERAEESPSRRDVARRVSRESIVLLTNAGVLPLEPARLRSLAVIGPAAHPGLEQGGGSAFVWPHRRVSPLDGLREALPDTKISWARGCALGRFASQIHPGLLSEDGWQIKIRGADEVPIHLGHVEDVRSVYHLLHVVVPGAEGFERDAPNGSVTVELRTRFTPDQSGPWELRLACDGEARASIDGLEVMSCSGREPRTGLLLSNLPSVTSDVQLDAGAPVDIAIAMTIAWPERVPHIQFGATPPRPELEIARAAELAAAHDAAIVVVGTGPDVETEGRDREDFGLPGAQDALVEAVLAAQPNTLVVVAAGAPVALPWVDRAPAVLWAWFGGQEAGHALADVIIGAADPGGRLPTTLPRRLEDCGSHANYPGDGEVVQYREGSHIGYRWHLAAGIDPVFAFGHGMSYTSFTLDSPSVLMGGDGSVTVTVAVRNTGTRAGIEVVQVYVEPAADESDAPPLQLAGFAKVRLDASEARGVVVRISPRAFASWDVGASSWVVAEGIRTLRVGRSVVDLPHGVEIVLQGRRLPSPQE